VSRLGIDFGTTNSVAAIDGAPVDCFEGGVRSPILPSAVAFPPTGVVLVGAEAKRRRVIDPAHTIVSSKRLMGRHFHSYAVTQYREQHALDLHKDAHGGVLFCTRAGVFSPEDIAATILGRLVARLPPELRRGEVVMAVPSEFDEAARAATLAAGRRTGFGEVCLVEEPVATAYAYLARGEPMPELAAVYDLGGGTFDLSIVDCSRRPFRVLGHGGDAYLGGDDLDHAIASAVAAKVLAEHGWDLRSSREIFDRLLVESERVKIALEGAPEAELSLSQVDPSSTIAGARLVIDEAGLEAMVGRLVQRTFGICDQVLGEAGVRASEVGAVFLAGGGARVRGLRRDVARYFGREPCADLDPMTVVAVGASSLPT
jgi:molecular chaperone DnaK (HSP70)